MTLLLSLVMAASVGPVAFPAPGGFVILSRSGELLETISRPGGLTAEHLAVSPDGRRYVFTARSNPEAQPLLYRLERGQTEAAVLGKATGFHAQPTFTDDGNWVFFIFHPTKDAAGWWSQPPTTGEMADREYGQIWKVRIDGTGLEQVTKSRGCKLFPDARDAKTVTYTHTNCGATSMLELTTGYQVDSVIPMTKVRPHLPRFSGDGKRLAVVQLTPDEVLVVICESKVCSQLAELPRDADPSQVAWMIDDSSLLVSVGPSVWRIGANGLRSEHMNLMGVVK